MHEHHRKVPKVIFTRPKSPGLGHLALKSSVFAPTAMSFMGQDYVFNHMKSHYRRIASAKAAVDTTPPRALTSNVKVQDKKRREKLKNDNSPSSTPRPGTSRSEKSTYSTREERFSLNNTEMDNDFPTRTSTRNTQYADNELVYDRQSSRLREQLSRNSPRYSDVKEKSSQREDTRRWKDRTDEYNNHNVFTRGESSTRSASNIRDKLDTRLDLSGLTYKPSPGLMARPGKKETSRRDPHLIIWENDQKYLNFTQEVTADVLARGIFSDRVLNKVFESHIEKNREELDEERMHEMIEQLRIDLGMENDS